MRKNILYTVLSVLFVPAVSFAQTTNDFGVWSSIGVNKSLSKKLSLEGELENRTTDNSSQVSRWGLQLGGSYKVMKFLSIGGAYQFQYYHDLKYSDFQPRNRFILYTQGKYKWNKFSFSLRERLQITTKDESDRIKASGKIDTYRINPSSVWRNRLKVDYNIPKSRFTPFASFESFYQLNNPEGNEFEGLRYTIGTGYKINKRSFLDFSGIYDKEINTDEPTNRFVISLGYTYNLK